MNEPICRYRKKVLGVETTLELWRPGDFNRRVEAARDGQPTPHPPHETLYAGVVAPTETCDDLDAVLEVASEDTFEAGEATWILGRAAFGRGTRTLPLKPGDIALTNSYMANAFWITDILEDAPKECRREVLVYSPVGGLVLVPGRRKQPSIN